MTDDNNDQDPTVETGTPGRPEHSPEELLVSLEAVATAVGKVDERLRALEERQAQTNQDQNTADDRDHLAELPDWVQWLCDNYAAERNVRDWYNIPAIRNELLALKIAADHAFSADAGPFDAVYWHQYFQSMISRLDWHRDRQKKADETSQARDRRERQQRQPADNLAYDEIPR